MSKESTKPNAFVIRSSPSRVKRINLVLQDDQIIIGWSKTQNLLLDKNLTRDDFKRILIDYYPEYRDNSYSLGQAAGYLWRFIREMKIGDYALVPIPHAFYLGRVTSDVKFERTGMKTDSWIRRDVEWLNNKAPISRDKCDAGLISRLKYQGTCVGASDLIGSIENALHSSENNVEVSFQQQAHNRLKEGLAETLSSNTSYMSPQKFEELIRQLLDAMGAETSIIPPNSKYKDSIADVDVIADFKYLGMRIYVQAKYHNTETDEHAIKQVIEAIKIDNPDNLQPILGWAVSTSTFSEKAIHLANENGIRCIDVDELAEMMVSIGLDKFEM